MDVSPENVAPSRHKTLKILSIVEILLMTDVGLWIARVPLNPPHPVMTSARYHGLASLEEGWGAVFHLARGSL